jgi:hypothetical protein
MFVPEDARWLLAESDEVEHCVAAMEAAIRHGMITEIEAGLSHRFAHVVALSLRHLAATSSSPLPESLLALADSRGSPVRRALAEVLQDKPHAAHMRTLLQLAADKWSRDASYRGEEDDYPIAQVAITAIAKLSGIDAGAADALYAIAVETRDSSVRFAIFELLVRSGDARFQERLFDLAVAPGNVAVRQAAAKALVVGSRWMAPDIVAKLTPDVVKTRVHGVAAWLLLLAALCGDMDQLLGIAGELAAHSKRRVLVLLVIWVLTEKDAALAQRAGQSHQTAFNINRLR